MKYDGVKIKEHTDVQAKAGLNANSASQQRYNDELLPEAQNEKHAIHA